MLCQIIIRNLWHFFHKTKRSAFDLSFKVFNTFPKKRLNYIFIAVILSFISQFKDMFRQIINYYYLEESQECLKRSEFLIIEIVGSVSNYFY